MSPPQARPNFIVERVQPDDLDQIVELIHDSFSQEESALLGCPDPSYYPNYRERILGVMESDPSDIWIQVKDVETGKVAAVSNWRVFMNGKPDDRGDEPVAYYTGEDREESERSARFMNENRRKAMTGPFVYLHLCCTSPDYRHMGAGSLMMQWGVDLADALFLPGWIEASVEGTGLYKAFGFYVSKEVELHGLPIAHMKRDPRSKGIDGAALRRKKA